MQKASKNVWTGYSQIGLTTHASTFPLNQQVSTDKKILAAH